MNSEHHAAIQAFMDRVAERNPNEPEFLQAVEEVAEAIIPFMEEHPKYKHANILERIVEPERVIMFKVPWTDDAGEVHVNRGFRIEFNSAIGPYKGGLRFHPTVNLSILKFLGFEQVFKNSSGPPFPWVAARGGLILTPKGKATTRSCASARAS